VLIDTRYIYDGMLVVQERNGSNVPTVSYTRGLDLSATLDGAGGIGGLLARSHGYSAGNWSTHAFYHADGNGNITCLLTNQTVVGSYRYDPYGRPTYTSGSLASANLYRFSSKPIHVNSGLYYYGYRFYYPELQRWMNPDLIEEWGGINLYVYVKNCPLSNLDPLGLDAITFWFRVREFFQPTWHRYRNIHNQCPAKQPKGGTDSRGNTWSKDLYSGGHGGNVYRSPKGYECVYDCNGNLLPNMGTYNYGPNPFTLKHVWYDWAAHYIYGNRYVPDLTTIYE